MARAFHFSTKCSLQLVMQSHSHSHSQNRLALIAFSATSHFSSLDYDHRKMIFSAIIRPSIVNTFPACLSNVVPGIQTLPLANQNGEATSIAEDMNEVITDEERRAEKVDSSYAPTSMPMPILAPILPTNYITCPYCGRPIEILAVACTIFRCGVLLRQDMNPRMKQLNPHASERECIACVSGKRGVFMGCGMPFIFDGSKVSFCDFNDRKIAGPLKMIASN